MSVLYNTSVEKKIRLNDLSQLELAKSQESNKKKYPLRLNHKTTIYVKKKNLNEKYKQKMIKRLRL
jgi:hypothetical protein